MDKARQKYLQKWLRAQQAPIKKITSLNVLLASFSALILVAQTFCLAIILQGLIMEKAERGSLLPYFIGLFIGFIIRAGILWYREKIGFQAGKKIRNVIRQQILNKIEQVDRKSVV